MRKRIVRELQIMHGCHSEHIVTFYGAFLNDNNDVIMCMEYMDVGYAAIICNCFVNMLFLVLTSTPKLARPGLSSLWPSPGRCAGQDRRSNPWWPDLPLLEAPHHAPRHQALQHPRQFPRPDQALRLWRIWRARQLSCRHLCRNIYIHGSGANPRREVHSQV